MPPTLISSREDPVCMDAVREFESEFLRVFPHATLTDAPHLGTKRFLVRVFRRTYRHHPRALLTRRLRSTPGTFQMSVQMGPDFALAIPSFLLRGPNFIYMFDAWPRYMPWLVDFANHFNVKAIFFSARQSCQLFNERGIGGRTRGHWLPEGIAPDDYTWLPVDGKVIDVLEFGRRHEAYHNQIRPALQAAGAAHVYAKPGELLFPSKHDLCHALSRAKICICFPSSVTDPERAEGVSTMTLRYLQAMISRCLVVGQAPSDIAEVFGYDPVIAYDGSDPAGQLLDVARNFETYQPLVERNHAAVLSSHLWRNRIESVRSLLTDAA
ncbi:MAG: glycosyltransferase [Polyangia bacterium]